jgi:hypothetical protein
LFAQSTTEAEYMAIDETLKEYVWLKSLYAELCDDDSYVTYFMTIKVLYT